MILRIEGDRFHLILEGDEAASLVDDICLLADKIESDEEHEEGFCAFTWELVQQINRLWWHKFGCSITDGIEAYMAMEDEG